jgi:hypothetical protein
MMMEEVKGLSMNERDKFIDEYSFMIPKIDIDNVALHNCSQEADQAAIKFHWA